MRLRPGVLVGVVLVCSVAAGFLWLRQKPPLAGAPNCRATAPASEAIPENAAAAELPARDSAAEARAKGPPPPSPG